MFKPIFFKGDVQTTKIKFEKYIIWVWFMRREKEQNPDSENGRLSCSNSLFLIIIIYELLSLFYSPKFDIIYSFYFNSNLLCEIDNSLSSIKPFNNQ